LKIGNTTVARGFWPGAMLLGQCVAALLALFSTPDRAALGQS